MKAIAPPLSVIWKFPVEISDDVDIAMPFGAEILAFQVQDETPTIWVAVDPAQPLELRHFRVVGTGHSMARSHKGILEYLGTVQWKMNLVWHLFEKR